MLEKKGRIYLKHNVFTKDIPICVAFRCMGIESDQEIMALVCFMDMTVMRRLAMNRNTAATSI